MDGTIADWVPEIMDAFARIHPVREWPAMTMVDFTAGSCLMPALFAASGVRRLIVNDFAARSYVAARFLFGGRKISMDRVAGILKSSRPKSKRHVPTFHFACDYFLEPVCEIFDRLYHADVPEQEKIGLQYLAIRWALGFARTAEDGFEILYSHDTRLLAQMRDVDWRPYLSRMRGYRRVIATLVRELNASIDAIGNTQAKIHCADMIDVAEKLRLSTPVFAAVNPPTRGLDEYTIDDQLVHSLMANRWLPLSKISESPLAFWIRRVSAALEHLPENAFYMVWGGDGSMHWRECFQVWALFGEPLHISRLGQGNDAPGWAIFKRTKDGLQEST
ncbi:MAG: hypothetical protein GC202_04495 [Alphaproteobacteria bacterium]|nr:hypothetical protein [Alphaproteobacteria bacterium]